MGNTAEAAAWLSGTLTGRAVQGPLPALAFFPDTLLPLFCEENLSSMPGLPLPGLSLMTHALSVPQLYHKQAQLCHIPSGEKTAAAGSPSPGVQATGQESPEATAKSTLDHLS